MKGRRHTPEQIVRKLREADRLLGEGQDIAEVAKHLEISEATFHRWRAQYGGMKANCPEPLKWCQLIWTLWVPRTSSVAFGATRAAKPTSGPNAPSSAIAIGHLAGCFVLLPEPRGDGLQPWT
jgi:hypothetical protein